MINLVYQPTTPFASLENILSLGFFFIVIGYQFLLFVYFFLIKYRTKRKMYWFYFSFFFLFIAISRVLFVVYDFLMPYAWEMLETNPLLPLTVNRFAQFTGWIAVATLVGVLSTLLFTKDNQLHKSLRIIFPLIVVGISLLFFILPDELLIDPSYYLYQAPYNLDHGLGVINTVMGKAVGLFVLNYVVLILLNFLLPILFFYLAYRSVGIIQKSSILNGLGFLLYYIGRSLQPLLVLMAPEWVNTQVILPPLIILLGLLFLALGNLMLQT
ncbi:MAG: hypothetical protein ACTSWY_07685 [Promethearchaeota archaeon]